MVVKAGYNN